MERHDPMKTRLLMAAALLTIAPGAVLADSKTYTAVYSPELDLQTRTFKYPVSYLVYSDAFNVLPAEVKRYLYSRIRQILEGSDQDPAFSQLDRESLVAAAAILRDTKPEIFN